MTISGEQPGWLRRSFDALSLYRAQLSFVTVAAVFVVAVVIVIAQDEPSLTRLDGGSGVPFGRRLPQLIDVADTVFVGTVDAIAGPDAVRLPDGRVTPVAYRVTYRVERLLKGEPTAKVVLTDPTDRGLPTFSAEVGRKYLVFAASVAFGSRDVRRLIPVDESHGVFLTRDARTATNDRHLAVDVDELEARLGCRRVILGTFFVRC